jgi:DNA-binding CsgD family transcriptional regulator/PAS domain-containing protein
MGARKTPDYYPEDSAGLLELVGEIYQAGLEPERWPQVLKQLSDTFAADLACIYTPIVARPEQAIYLTHNFSEASQTAYSAYYHQHDAWTRSAVDKSIYIQGTIVFGEQLILPSDLHRTEFYQDFLKPNGMEWIITTALFDGRHDPDTPATHMTFTRHPQQRAFEADQLALLELLAPHVRRALKMHWQLTQMHLREAMHASALDQLGYGLILIGQDGGVMYLNEAAEKMIWAADGLSLRASRLQAATPEDQDALNQLIREACIGLGGSLYLQRNSTGENTAHTQTAPTGKQFYSLTASPLREDALPPAYKASLNSIGPRAMLLLQDPEQNRHKPGLEQFAILHRLTQAERRVLNLLLQDKSPKQIAEQLGVGIRTIRTQLSSLYTKTRTRNQRELIAQAMRIAGVNP